MTEEECTGVLYRLRLATLWHTQHRHTHTHTDTHAHRARLDERLPFGWTWQWFWNVDNCQIKITQAISQARIWMQVSEQKERATGSGPSDFTIYHRVSCALRKWSHTRMGGGQPPPLAVTAFHVYLDSKEGNRWVFCFKMCRERAWSGSFSVCFSPPSLPYQPGGSSVSSVGPGGGLGLGRVLSPGLSTSISVFSHVIDSVAMHPGDAHLSLSVPVKVFMCLLSSSQFYAW